MPVPSLITDLSTTPASNSPAGGEPINLADDYFRTHGAFIRALYDQDITDRADLASTASGKGAALVGYLPAGTGAVGRLLQDKVRDIVISAKDQGIVGDGTTDDTTALGNLLAMLGPGVKVSLDGLTIKVSAHTYVSNKSGFTLDGEGATIIAANGMAVVANNELLSFRSCTDFTAKNYTVDGNRANRTPVEVAAHNIEYRSCKRGLIERVRSINACVDGHILNTATPTDITTFCKDMVFFDCFADNSYRQGMSVINAIDCSIVYGAYENTNGTAPQAGIDIEANSGAATPGNGRVLVHKVRLEGNSGRGIVVSNVSSAREIVLSENTYINNTLGAVDVAGNAVTIRGGSASGHGGSVVNGIITFDASGAIKAGACEGVTFTGNTSTTPCMHIHAAASGVKLTKNFILDHPNGGGIVMNGSDCSAENNIINSAGGIGVLMSGIEALCANNIIVGTLNRGIYSTGSTRPTIRGNTVRDITSVSGGYIQSDDADAVVDDNHCIASSAQATTIGVLIGANAQARSMSGNICVNLHTTNPYSITGTGTVKQRQHNQGGTANSGDMGWSKFLKSDFTTVALLPNVLTYSVCRSMVTDATTTTFGAAVVGGGANVVPVYSDGVTWRIG
jgi:parallel beta-helix repeat protein